MLNLTKKLPPLDLSKLFESYIVDILKERRNQLRLDQRVVSAKVGLSQNGFSKIELKYTKLTLEMFFKICEALDVHPKIIIDKATSFADRYRA